MVWAGDYVATNSKIPLRALEGIELSVCFGFLEKLLDKPEGFDSVRGDADYIIITSTTIISWKNTLLNYVIA